MANVTTPDGRDLGDVTGRALDYYRREPGFTIDGETVEAPETPEVEVISPPAKSALKGEWVDYAKTVDPDNADEIDGMTQAEIMAKYGPTE